MVKKLRLQHFDSVCTVYCCHSLISLLYGDTPIRAEVSNGMVDGEDCDNSTAGMSERLIRKLDGVKVDAVMALVSGVVGFVTAINVYRNTHLPMFKQVFVSSDQTDVIGWMAMLACTSGFISSVLGAYRLTSNSKVSFNKFVVVLVMSLIGNFIAGIILTEYKKQVHRTLESSMNERLTEAVITKEQYGIGFGVNEAWDYLQVKMHCCGVEGYRDYFQVKGFSTENAMPQSCCVMKPTLGSDLTPENGSQCRLDAVRALRNSIFLYTQGCFHPLSRWLTKYLSKIISLIFASLVLQAVGVLYLSWKGYRKTNFIPRPD